MKEIIIKKYQCETCGSVYASYEDAINCEGMPLDTTDLRVGDFVGAGAHGWWYADTSWTLSQLPGEEDWLDVPDDGWGRSPPGPSAPVKRLFLPIWMIVSIEKETVDEGWKGCGHRLRFILWCPRHANREHGRGKNYGEAIVKTYSRFHRGTGLRIADGLRPKLTRAEWLRFQELRAEPPEHRRVALL